MQALRPGVWHWQSPHPAWNEEQWWPHLVSSYGIEVGDDVLLFDPLSVSDEMRGRATAVVLTAPWHERDARQLGLPVHTPPADTWEDWVSKFGDGLDVQLGGRTHVTRDDVVQRLRSLLDLPIELVLPAHGEPQDRATLERVLS